MNDLMLDMETWDTGREAAVRAISSAIDYAYVRCGRRHWMPWGAA